jgi:N-formylmaleamate deformylase
MTNVSGWTEGDVDVNGVGIHFYRTGHGEHPALVLAHGLTDNGLCWSRVAHALEGDFDVVMIDARSHGKSASASGDSAVLAADLAAVISALGLDQPAVMGHSVGAGTMAELAAAHPTVVSRLVLEDPPWRADAEGDSEMTEARREAIRGFLRSFAEMSDLEILELGRKQHPDWLDEEYPAWADAKRQVREQATDSLSPLDWSESVVRIECPTLLIHGDTDRGGIVTPEVAQQVENLNGRVTTSLIEDAGHNIRRENFGRYINVVRDFLKPSRPSAGED